MLLLGFAGSAVSALADTVLAEETEGSLEPARRVSNLTGGELMLEFLRDWDVPYVFGLGGSEEVGFLDAMSDAPDVKYILALHEASAMAMADGYARSSGKTAFLNLHSVAGASYALGQMVNAFKDRTPLVVTVGRQSTDMRGSDAFLEAVNLHTLPGPYSRWSWDVLRSDSIPAVLRRAFLTSRLPPSGPTFLTFSKDLWEQNVADSEIISPNRSMVDARLRPNSAVVTALADRLLDAQFPILVAGRELSRYGGTHQLVELAELLGVAVMTDVPASHTPITFPTLHPNYAGMFSLDPNPSDDYDLFWSIGGSMFSLFAAPAKPLVRSEAAIVHTSVDAAQLGRNYPVDIAAIGQPDSVLADVLVELRTRKLPSARIRKRQEIVRTAHFARKTKLADVAQAVWDQNPIAPERLAVDLNDRIDPNAIVVCELATSDLFIWQYMDFAQSDSGRTHMTSGGGCLGWGTGAAIGAKIAQPERPVILLVGDGSFQFGVQALWSSARYRVPVAIIIWNNNAYQANRRALHNYGKRAAQTGHYIGTYLGSPTIDNVKIASGYGVDGERVDDPKLLGQAIDRCLEKVATGMPYVLDVAIQTRFGGADSKWHSGSV
jgi:benzoylformate decarboxylase